MGLVFARSAECLLLDSCPRLERAAKIRLVLIQSPGMSSEIFLLGLLTPSLSVLKLQGSLRTGWEDISVSIGGGRKVDGCKVLCFEVCWKLSLKTRSKKSVRKYTAVNARCFAN